MSRGLQWEKGQAEWQAVCGEEKSCVVGEWVLDRVQDCASWIRGMWQMDAGRDWSFQHLF